MSGLTASWFLGIVMGGAILVRGSCAIAQITPDGTLPNNSIVTPDGNTLNITGGTQAGSNLFHSFGEFSVPNGSEAFFNNAADIQNIFGRVTGGSVSNIDGLIKASGTANLFLINPNGIVFGKNASLDVRGSFVGTTANAIQFSSLGSFSATNPEAPSPLLTINPSALLFNQIAAGGSIQNSSTAPAGIAPTGGNASGLRVPDGKSLLLVGGNISMDGGQLNAYGGRVELGGLAASGNVGLNVDGDKLSLDFPASSTRANISLTNGAAVYVAAGEGGDIAVNARNLEVSGGSVLSAGIGQGLGNAGAKAGDITLNATGDVKIDGRSAIGNNVRRQSIGNGGNITLSTNSLSLTNGAQLQAITFGQGDAGNVIINATNSVSLDGSRSVIFSSVESVNATPEQRNSTKGNGGNIQITSPQLSLTNGAQLQAVTSGQGNAGNVIINATKSVSLDGSSVIFSNVGDVNDSLEQRNSTKGNGGNIQITSPQLSLTNGAQLNASTKAQGNSGSVIINATNSVSLDGSKSYIFSSVGNADDSPGQRNATKGNGGNIQITSPQLSLTNRAGLVTSTAGQGNAGNVIINATKSVSLDGRSAIFSTVGDVSDTPEQRNATKGNGGTIQITSPQLSLTNRAGLDASTSGQGDAGNIIINATKSVSLDGRSDIFSAVGDVSDTPEQRNATKGNGANIQITSPQLSLTNGAQLSASTLGQGNAGTIKVNAAEDVTISGKSSNFNSGLYVNSQSPTGTAGDIIVTSPRVTLDNTGILNAQSESGNGGNINLQSDLLIMRRGAQISTTAGTAQQGGDGGKITINAPNGFIVAVPNENSDITANAFSGSGGSVTINATGIFGITPRSREDLIRLLGTNLDAQLLPTSDITAISQTSPTLNGTVQINTLGIDPTQGLVNLPVIPVDTKVAQGCYTPGYAQSSFVITGRGGLPPNPKDIITPDATQIDWVSVKPSNNNRSLPPVTIKPTTSIPKRIVEATGWVRNALGEVELVANAPTTPHNSWHTPVSCRTS